jgi:hypothetical protein
MSVKTLIEHGGVTYSAAVMVIKRTTLGYEDHGILTGYLHCSGDGTGVGVGGFCLDESDKSANDYGSTRKGTAYGLDWIIQVLKTVGVDKWEDLPGKRVYVLTEGGDGERLAGWGKTAAGIANIDTGSVFLMKEHAARWRESVLA